MTRPSGIRVNGDTISSEELRGGGQRVTPVFSDATPPPGLQRAELVLLAVMFFLIGFFAVLNFGGRP